ncbi:MAG: NUDIX hydrolase [Dehalococcoidales bacterium]|nr:MAG: NUDIX hydrolase [Dehalococcoidales bacterium]
MENTDSKLASFIATSQQVDKGSVVWDTMPLKYAYYVGNELPPSRYVSSVRAIVFQDDSVLVIKARTHQYYILPGGRCEKGESPEETLRREVLEETGWTLKGLTILGFMHFHHLGPRPAEYSYPYPDFIWPIYSAQADRHIPEAIQPDDYVKEARFHALYSLPPLNIEKGELALLDAAIKLRQDMI